MFSEPLWVWVYERHPGVCARRQQGVIENASNTGSAQGYIWSGVWRSPPPLPPKVWSGRGRVRRGVGAAGAAAGGVARVHRQGQDRTQALRKP